MTNEQKAREIADSLKDYVLMSDYGKSLRAAKDMAAWKDKQFSDRVEMTLCIDCHEFESCDNCPKYQIKKELLKL